MIASFLQKIRMNGWVSVTSTDYAQAYQQFGGSVQPRRLS